MSKPIRCYECNGVLGPYYILFQKMRQIRLENDPQSKTVHIANRTIDPRQEQDMQVVFNELHIYNTCCRAHIGSYLNPQELKYRNTFIDNISPINPENNESSTEE